MQGFNTATVVSDRWHSRCSPPIIIIIDTVYCCVAARAPPLALLESKKTDLKKNIRPLRVVPSLIFKTDSSKQRARNKQREHSLTLSPICLWRIWLWSKYQSASAASHTYTDATSLPELHRQGCKQRANSAVSGCFTMPSPRVKTCQQPAQEAPTVTLPLPCRATVVEVDDWTAARRTDFCFETQRSHVGRVRFPSPSHLTEQTPQRKTGSVFLEWSSLTPDTRAASCSLAEAPLAVCFRPGKPALAAGYRANVSKYR